MYILGISCYYHDAAAALLKDGEIIAASEEERFSRKKHDSTFPKNAINFCLQTGKIRPSDLSYIVFYEKPFRKFHRILLSSLSTYPKSLTFFREAMSIWLAQKLWIKQEISSFLKISFDKILFCEHHLSHAASCFYPSPFKKAAILTVDGTGEWTTSSWGTGSGNRINLTAEMHFPQSLGLFYSAFTAFLGFEVNEGEWKTMGLSAYGKPIYADKVRKTIKQHSNGSYSLDFSYFSFHYSDKYSFSRKLTDLLGAPVSPYLSHLVTQRSADIAASVQLVTEEILLNMTKNVKKQTGMENLCLAGGVALNSLANYQILKKSGFKNIYIQPAAGDSGGALGATLYLYHHVLNKNNRQLMTKAYLGKQFGNNTIEQFLQSQHHDDIKIIYLSEDKLITYITNQLIKGKVIGWIQGRSEWGPRALGSRSILADARDPKMKEIINSKVKFREAFRPFAPSVLAEYSHEVFELPTANYQLLTTHHPLRFMLYVVPVKRKWRKKVPAINHIDNTARPQLVYEKDNPLYYKLIKSFFKKTGIPLLLNTSFNLRGEPIVSSPYDAYTTFVRSGIDIVVMGNFVCIKGE